MKISQLGTFGIIAAVVSITSACGGSPTKPTAINSVIGDGASASSVNVSNPRPALEICTNQPPADAGEDQAGDAPAAPVVMCDVPATNEPTDDAVISDPSTTDDLQSAKALRR